jgi:hypothetical protein
MRRRIIGRPLLVATATIAVAAYACSTQTAGNFAAGDGSIPDVAVSETSGNLFVPVDAGHETSTTDATTDATDASVSDATADVGDATDGG